MCQCSRFWPRFQWDDAIKMALLGSPSRYRPIFEVVLDECGTWEQLAESAAGSACTRTFCQMYIFSLFGGLGKCLPSRQRLSGSGPFTSALFQILFFHLKRGG